MMNMGFLHMQRFDDFWKVVNSNNSSAMNSKLLFFALIISTTMQAQKFTPGEYHLTGVREMASAFNFTKDGKFQFFLSYGAMDRNATGTYKIEGDTVKLFSDKEPGKDFDIVSQRKAGSGYTIRIIDQNSILASNVRCLYFVDGEQFEEFADDDGVITLDVPECEKIYVQHALYADIASLIKDENNTNNVFELKLKPVLEQVSFKGVDFFIDGDTLTCLPNYFMPMENIRFVRR